MRTRKSDIYLAKANNRLLASCTCSRALTATPALTEFPWLGPGFLFRCIECGYLFTFAKAVLVDESREEIIRREYRQLFGEDPSASELSESVELMDDIYAGVELGQEYVWLDGDIFPVNAKDVRFQGWCARHDFGCVPHVAALEDCSIMHSLLLDPDYWKRNAVPQE
jgi:hypothetical protein